MNIKNIILIIILNMNVNIFSRNTKDNEESVSFFSMEYWSNSYKAIETATEVPRKAIMFLVNCGRNQEAKDHLDHQKETTERLTISLQNLTANQAGPEKITEAIHQNTETNQERNEILKDGLNKFENIEKAVKVAGVVYTTASIVKDTYALYKFFYPNEDQELKKEETIQKLKILRSKRALNECLVRNAEAQKDGKGIPVRCKEATDAYADAAGYEELGKIEKAFKARKG